MENINSGWEFQKLYQTDIDKICNMDEISFDREAFEQVDCPIHGIRRRIPIRERSYTEKK